MYEPVREIEREGGMNPVAITVMLGIAVGFLGLVVYALHIGPPWLLAVLALLVIAGFLRWGASVDPSVHATPEINAGGRGYRTWLCDLSHAAQIFLDDPERVHGPPRWGGGSHPRHTPARAPQRL
ncbi:hypothetical protein DK389_26620 [Methylobacterium durans]|uniref:Uncharacterized protein n=1 Tax=Methylobacterium durans TaxID=2202825 RepID=A0A2U8WDA5_9HYPH|nr:hypothetical protein DK389_26620 [Methylobacterium durans]